MCSSGMLVYGNHSKVVRWTSYSDQIRRFISKLKKTGKLSLQMNSNLIFLAMDSSSISSQCANTPPVMRTTCAEPPISDVQTHTGQFVHPPLADMLISNDNVEKMCIRSLCQFQDKDLHHTNYIASWREKLQWQLTACTI